MLKQISSWVFARMFGVILAGLLAGCAVHHNFIQPASIAFIHPGVTTKSEVAENLGPPTRVLEAERVYTYEWEDPDPNFRHRRQYYRHYFEASHYRQFDVNHHTWSFCVAFDEAGRVTRHEFLDTPTPDALNEEIAQWLKTPAR